MFYIFLILVIGLFLDHLEPKAQGTKWLYEILSMVQRRSAARVQDTKMSTMLEANPADVIDTRSSPRVLNTHYRPRCYSGFWKGYSLNTNGEVGDWKNWFTVAKSEKFDAVWTSKIRPDTMFHFRYSL
ncbi:uncharacterized protein LOC128230861 [Mya arenaria]|uniref:uncharacterized protein LOC128230861 n=1 Tax=Mya arenaria TaxID=6604 RepID=UPI0022E006C7|nr:uncharacterized protein LOC128230861 [Mya arenaria]